MVNLSEIGIFVILVKDIYKDNTSVFHCANKFFDSKEKAEDYANKCFGFSFDVTMSMNPDAPNPYAQEILAIEMLKARYIEIKELVLA